MEIGSAKKMEKGLKGTVRMKELELIRSEIRNNSHGGLAPITTYWIFDQIE